MALRISKTDNRPNPGAPGGINHLNDHIIMQPHYIGENSKTSRTLGVEENDTTQNQGYKGNQNGGQSGYLNNSVIRREPRIHRRNRLRKTPYYLTKNKNGQKVSYFTPHALPEDHPEALVQTNGSPAPCRN